MSELADELRALMAKATPGPWTFYESGIDYGFVGPGNKPTVLFGESCEGAVGDDDPDALFLVALRNRAPLLLAALELAETDVAYAQSFGNSQEAELELKWLEARDRYRAAREEASR